MSKKFSELVAATMTPDAIERARLRAQEMLGHDPLDELRRARGLAVGQPAIAELERRADLYVSNLRTQIEAMGGKLAIVARFPAGEVEITNFAALAEDIDSVSGESTS